MDTVSVARFKLSSVFVYGYIANLVALAPFAVFFGLSGLMGREGVYRYGEPVYGTAALVTALVILVSIPLAPALGLTVGTAVLRLLRTRAPQLSLRTISLS